MAKYVYCTCDQNCDVLRKVAEPGKSIADTHPHLTAEWHPTQNGCYTVDKFTAGAGYRATWICEEEGHIWQTSISNRARLGSGCPTCWKESASERLTGVFRKVEPGKSLAGILPGLARFWHSEKNTFTPFQVTLSSERRAWWFCPEGHEWETEIGSAVTYYKKRDTIACRWCASQSRRIPKPGRSLADVYPEVAKSFHPTKNGDKTAFDYNARANEYVWWLCDKDHETYALINSKAVGHGCAKCNTKNHSKIEAIFKNTFENNALFSVVHQSTQRIHIPWRGRAVMSVDVLAETIYGQKVAVEYDGSYHHDAARFSDIQERDMDKTNALLDADYLVIRVRENRLEHLKIEHSNLFQVSHCYPANQIRLSENVDKTVCEIVSWITQKSKSSSDKFSTVATA